jgi:hypothetical protein
MGLPEKVKIGKGAFPPSHFRTKLADKLTVKIASVSLWQPNFVCSNFLTVKHD